MQTVCLDLETHCFQPGLSAPPIVCGSIASDDAPNEARLLTKVQAIEAAGRVLKSERLAGAHIFFDLGCLAAAVPEMVDVIFQAFEEGRVVDTHTRQALIDIALGCLFKDPVSRAPFEKYHLQILVQRHLGIDLTEEKYGANSWRLRYAQLENVPHEQWPAEAREYPLRDAKFPLQVLAAQEAQAHHAPNRGNLSEETRTNRAAWALHLASLWGIRTDPDAVKALDAEVTRKHEETLARFQKEGIYRADGSKNMKRLQELVEAAYLGNPPRSPKSGKPVTDRDTLYESGDDLLEALAETGENEKNFSTYLPVLRQGTVVPINPETNVLVSTGRTSYRRPNLQNLPRDDRFRQCFVPRPGRVFCSVDYSTLELCTLAQVCLWRFGWSRMAEALQAGQDLHVRFAADTANLPYEEMKRMVKVVKDHDAIALRLLAKQANFGLPGGMGPAKLVATGRKQAETTKGPDGTEYAGIRFCIVARVAQRCGERREIDRQTGRPVCSACLAVAKKLRADWLRQWPEMDEYFAWVGSLTETDYAAIQIPPDGLVRGDCSFTSGCNLGFQGLAARGAKHAMWLVSKEAYTDRRSPLWDCRPVVFVHDEILSELVDTRLHEAAMRQAEVMVAAMREHTPDIPIKAEPAVADRWFKKMEPAFDPVTKRLTRWRPEA